MASDSIAGFLDQAQAVRVLFPEQVEQLIRQPDVPQSDLSQLCEYLLARGVVTRYQAEAIRDRGRARALGANISFAFAGLAATLAVATWIWPEESGAPRVVVVPTAGGAALGLGARF